MNLTNPDGSIDWPAVTAALDGADSAESARIEHELAFHIGADQAQRAVITIEAELAHHMRVQTALATLGSSLDEALGALAAGGRALAQLRDGDAFYVEFEGSSAGDMAERIGTAAVAVRQAKALNPNTRALLIEATSHVTACPRPPLVDGHRKCLCGEHFPCRKTKLAWQLRGLDRDQELARLEAEGPAAERAQNGS